MQHVSEKVNSVQCVLACYTPHFHSDRQSLPDSREARHTVCEAKQVFVTIALKTTKECEQSEIHFNVFMSVVKHISLCDAFDNIR
jgi:hypothetical protein